MPRIERIQPWVQTAAILIGGVWVGAVWLHQNVYLPSLRTNFVNVLPEIEIVGGAQGYRVVKVSIVIENTGERPAYSRHASVALYGSRTAPPPADAPPWPLRALEALNDTSSPGAFSQARVATPEKTLAFGRFMAPAEQFEPGERNRYESVLFAPAGYDLIRAEVRVYHAPEPGRFGGFALREGAVRISDDALDIDGLHKSEASVSAWLGP